MRFGIMTMQVNTLIPGDAAPGELLARLTGFDHVELVRRLAGQGFKTIELSGDLTLFFPQAFSPETIMRLKALKDELGLSYTIHIPLWSIEPSTPLEPVRQGVVRAVIDFIKATLPLAPEVYVLHATGELAAEFSRMREISETARPFVLQLFQGYARASIRTILAETGIPPRLLAIETIEFPFNLTLALADEFDLSICLDVGHVLAGFSGAVELFDALEQVLPRLGEIHLHDCPWQGAPGSPGHKIRYGEDHQALGKGDLDTARLLDTLAAAGFTGPLVFELREDEARDSLDVIRALRPAALNAGG